MKLSKFRELTENLSGNTEILTPSRDHSYREVCFDITTVLYRKELHIWSEDYGEEDTPEKKYGKRMEVIVIN
jgi:hypothetical protein